MRPLCWHEEGETHPSINLGLGIEERLDARVVADTAGVVQRPVRKRRRREHGHNDSVPRRLVGRHRWGDCKTERTFCPPGL